MLVVASFLACLKDDFLGSVTDFVSKFALPVPSKRVGLFLQWCWKRPIFPVIKGFLGIKRVTESCPDEQGIENVGK